MNPEKQTQPILVPRSPEQGADPSTRKVEVWQTHADTAALGAADRIMAIDYSKPIHIIDPEGGKTEIKYPTKGMGYESFSPEGQAKLAAELAGLPLRGDKIYAIHEGKVIEGTMGEFLSTGEGAGKLTYGAFVAEDGSAFGVYMDSLTPKSQAELAEAYGKQAVLKQGHAELDAAEVDEPDPFSYEAKLARDAKAEEAAQAIEARREGLPAKAWWYGKHEVNVIGYTEPAPDGSRQIMVYEDIDPDQAHLVDEASLSFEPPVDEKPAEQAVEAEEVPQPQPEAEPSAEAPVVDNGEAEKARLDQEITRINETLNTMAAPFSKEVQLALHQFAGADGHPAEEDNANAKLTDEAKRIRYQYRELFQQLSKKRNQRWDLDEK